jgi:acetate kinase
MAVLHMMRRDGLSVDEVEHALCNESGLKGLSGKYNDIRDIQSAADSGDANARLALEVFVQSVRHWIGAYMVQLNGLDALVFTAGIGENRAEIRAEICANMDQIGIELDPSKNSSIKAEEAIISSENSTVKVLVIPTNEELVVAREVKRFLENKQN